MKEVKLLRTTAGEDIIALSDGLTLYSPLQILPTGMPTPQGGLSFTFLPWPMFADRKDLKEKGVTLSEQYVAVIYSPNDQLKKQYDDLMMQEKGLIVPPKSLILPT